MATAFDTVEAADTERIAFTILPKDRADEFLATSEADFALSAAGLGRFRVNAFRQRGSVGLVLRRVLPGMPSIESLGLPGVVPRLAEETRGLILVTGPTASGRTTTLASMVDHINETRAVNIITIEDPVEVLHIDKMSIVNQRELGTDTRSYADALRRVARQDPDVVVVGGIEDSETLAAVLRAAEGGVLVLSTMQTMSATDTINRIIDLYPQSQMRQVRQVLANNLRGIVCQRLLERADGRGRVPAVEAMVMTGRVFDYVIDPDCRTTLEEVLSDGEYYGMQTFDQSLFGLYKNGLVSLRDVLAVASDVQEFKIALETAGLISPT
jgi:twitching motility protein PilT